MEAIILAGGKGTRLYPYTTVLPKSLMPIVDMPVLEIVIRQLKKAKFRKVTIAVGHLAEIIEAYFGNGKKWGIEIVYSMEDKPLGTAGPIALAGVRGENFLVMNGDILADVNYGKLVSEHIKSKAITTICVYDKYVKIDLGTLKFDRNDCLVDYIEKPTFLYKVSMGMYLFNRKILKYIKKNERLELPDLIKTLLENNEKINAYHHAGHWLDIGREEDYKLAIEKYNRFKDKFL